MLRRFNIADHSDEAGTKLTATIVSAYVSNNIVPSAEIPALISEVYSALMRVTTARSPQRPCRSKPAVPIKHSIAAEYIVCLEDGKKFKLLKRHLRDQYGMTVEQYRTKWGLPPDYPMVALNYSLVRSRIAKQTGLGLAIRGAVIAM